MTARSRALIASMALLAGAAGTPAAAQQYAVSPDVNLTPRPGWSLTPSLGVSQTWDDNVLLRGPGDALQRDLINTVNPGAELAFNGKRGQLTGRYDGAFLLYRSLRDLNSYEQHASLSAKRRMSRRNAFFINGSAAAVPTTELLQIIGVPYVRAGSRAEDVRAGIETMFSKRLTIAASAHVQHVEFDENAAFANLLLGGRSIGGGFVLRDRLSERTTLTAEYDLQHADIGARHDIFDVQNATVGLERQLTETMRISAAAGIARLGLNALGPAKTGPSWRLGFARNFGTSVFEALFYRSFVPSWSFGGTTQNEEATLRLRVPVSRRFYTQSMVSWRRDEPLVSAIPPLRSLWVQGSVGYSARSWVRVEGYVLATRQTVVQPDDLLAHNQFGIQVIASKPVRLR